MLWTAALGILGMLYGAIMEKTGLLTGLLERIKPIISSVGGLITTVIMTNIILLAATASQTLAIVVGGTRIRLRIQKEAPSPAGPLAYARRQRNHRLPAHSVEPLRRLYVRHAGRSSA